MFTTGSKWQRFTMLAAFAVVAVAAACSGSGNPNAIYPAAPGSGTIAGNTYQLPTINGLNSTMTIAGSGTLSATSSASAPSVGAIPLTKQRIQTSSSNSSLIYYTVTATSALTIKSLAISIGFATAPTESVYLAYWNGTEWVAGSSAGTYGSGAVTLVLPASALPITLASGQSLYMVAYEGQQIGTPPPPSPEASPNPLNVDLLTSTPVTVTTKPGLTITAVSSMPTIATINASETADSSGQATFTLYAAGPGQATITFTDPIGQKTTDVVTVLNQLPSPSPAPGAFTIGVTESTTIEVHTAGTLTITAVSGNTNVVTVSPSSAPASGGVATFTVNAVSAGQTTIKFTDPYNDSSTATINVSSIRNGAFTTSTGAASMSGWTPCSFQKVPYAAMYSPAPAPTPTAWSTQKPTLDYTPVPAASLAPLVTVTPVPPNVIVNATASPANPPGVGATAPPVLGSYALLIGSTGNQASPAGEFGACQTFTLSSASPYLSFWVWEGGSSYKFSQADQEADILDSTGTTLETQLFAELNCFQDQAAPGFGVPGQYSYDCDPTSSPPDQYYDWLNGGYWVERGPYDLLSGGSPSGLTAGTTYTLYVGQWSYYSNVANSYYSQYMFLGNVQTSTTSSFPTQTPLSSHRTINVTLPTKNIRTR